MAGGHMWCTTVLKTLSSCQLEVRTQSKRPRSIKAYNSVYVQWLTICVSMSCPSEWRHLIDGETNDACMN